MPRRPRVYQRVAARAAALGISAEQLARLTKQHPLRVQRLLNGTTRMLAEDVAALAPHLNVDPAYFYSDEARAS